MLCSEEVIPRMELDAWKTASPQFVIPESLLEESVNRAKREAEDYLITEESLLTGGRCLEYLVNEKKLHMNRTAVVNNMNNRSQIIRFAWLVILLPLSVF